MVGWGQYEQTYQADVWRDEWGHESFIHPVWGHVQTRARITQPWSSTPHSILFNGILLWALWTVLTLITNICQSTTTARGRWCLQKVLASLSQPMFGFRQMNHFPFAFLEERPPLWSSGLSSWLQILRPGFDSRHYQKKKKKCIWNGVHSASWLQLRSYLIEK
jgi:hypothetical protein